MYGYIYITTNNKNGKQYIGQHQKSYFDPKYHGSGVRLTAAIKRDGKDNFTTALLEECSTRTELDSAEIKWIKYYNAVRSDQFYNIAPGGGGTGSGPDNPHYGVHTNYGGSSKGHKLSEEQKRKMSEARKGKISGDRTYGNISDAHKAALKAGAARFNSDPTRLRDKASKAWQTRRQSGKTKTTRGLHIYTDGRIEVWAKECPEGMRSGRCDAVRARLREVNLNKSNERKNNKDRNTSP